MTPLGPLEIPYAKLTSHSPLSGRVRRTLVPVARALQRSPRPGTYTRPRNTPRGRYVTTMSEPSHSTLTEIRNKTSYRDMGIIASNKKRGMRDFKAYIEIFLDFTVTLLLVVSVFKRQESQIRLYQRDKTR